MQSMIMPAYAATLENIREAAARIEPYARRTPVLTSATLDALSGRALFFKCENFQRVGAFKFRGACNAVMKLPDAEAKRGVVTHSSGNFAQALALAARIRGIPAHIVMPRNAPAVKRRAVEAYGGQIHFCEPNLRAREATSQQVVDETGGVFIHPFNDQDIIAGQGTCALELMDECEGLDAIVVPIGGGGLISGICIAATSLKPAIRVFAAEPAGADDAAQSMAAGRFVPQENPDTIADGLRTSMGDLTWPIVRAKVDRVFTVSDEQTIDAMRLVWERMKIVIEASAAVAVAVVLGDEFKSLPGLERVGVVLSGGNVDLEHLPWLK